MISYGRLAGTLLRHGMTLEELAVKVGRRGDELRLKLNCGHYISMETLDRMCDVLKCRVEDIVEWKEGEQVISEPADRCCSVDWKKFIELVQPETLRSLSVKFKPENPAYLDNIRRRRWIKKTTLRKICRMTGIDYNMVRRDPPSDF